MQVDGLSGSLAMSGVALLHDFFQAIENRRVGARRIRVPVLERANYSVNAIRPLSGWYLGNFYWNG